MGNIRPEFDEEFLARKNEIWEVIKPIDRIKSVEESRILAKEVFGRMMRASWRRATNDKFQPCQDEIDYLKDSVKGVDLCNILRTCSLKQFYQILHPADLQFLEKEVNSKKSAEKRQNTAFLKNTEKNLQCNDSIFHIHLDSVAGDVKEFRDLFHRAETLAEEIDKKFATGIRNLQIYLLDGHGRMLVCLLHSLDRRGLIEHVDIHVYEINDEVHEYHKLVFPACVLLEKRSILSLPQHLLTRSIIYMNFCSIPSSTDYGWTDHFKEQNINRSVYGCCKENVLKTIWTLIQPPFNCSVMISFVLKHQLQPSVYAYPLAPNASVETQVRRGKALTGLGMLYFLRRPDLFDADLISVRPNDDEIEWEESNDPDQERRLPVKLLRGKLGCPFVTVLIKPKNTCKTLAWERGNALYDAFQEINVADFREEWLQVGATVEITDGKYKGKRGEVKSRTLAEAYIDIDRPRPVRVRIDKIKIKY